MGKGEDGDKKENGRREERRSEERKRGRKSSVMHSSHTVSKPEFIARPSGSSSSNQCSHRPHTLRNSRMLLECAVSTVLCGRWN